MPYRRPGRRTGQDPNNRNNTLVLTENDYPFNRREVRLARFFFILSFFVIALMTGLAIDSLILHKPYYPSQCYMRIGWVVLAASFGLGTFYSLKSSYNINRDEHKKNGRYIIFHRYGHCYTTSRTEYLISMLPFLIVLTLCFYRASTALANIFIRCL